MSNRKMIAPGVHTTTRTTGGVVFFDMARFDIKAVAAFGDTETPADTRPDETIDTQSDIIGSTAIKYSPWGTDNMQPKRLLDDIKACGVLNGGIHAKIRLGIGRGVEPMLLKMRTGDGKEELEPVMDAEIEEWMEENDLQTSAYGWFLDLTGLGQDIARLKYNKGGTKIGLCRRHDVSEMRYQVKNTKGQLSKVYLSGSFNTGGVPVSRSSSVEASASTADLITLDLLPQYGPVAYLKNFKEAQLRSKEFAMVTRLPDWARHYYSDPLWYAARDWVSIAKGVPKMKAAMFENNMRLKYKVIIHEDYWFDYVDGWESMDEKGQEAQRNKLYDAIDNYLVGAENAYKSIFIDGKGDVQEGKMFGMIDIVSIDDNTKQGELLPDSAAANIEILFALMMNPALMGASSFGKGYGGGAGSGSDIREATMVQIMIQEFERQSVSKKLNLVSRINGWKAKYPELVWRFPGMVLTTLDKGKSTESMIAGNPPG
jgi:hypothetical protein